MIATTMSTRKPTSRTFTSGKYRAPPRPAPVRAGRARLSFRSARRQRVDSSRVRPFPGLDVGQPGAQVAELVRAGQEHDPRERVDLEVDRRAVGQEHALLR